MDISDLKPTSDVVVVEIKDPRDDSPFKNDDGTQMTITLMAPHSRDYKKAMHEAADERIKRKKKEFTASELEEASLQHLVRITTDWDITYKGKKPKCDNKVVREVYEQVFWIRDQAEDALQDYEVFPKG